MTRPNWPIGRLSCGWTVFLPCSLNHSRSANLLSSQVHGSCKTVTTDFRPVPLSFMFVRNTEGQTEMMPLLTKKGRLNPDLVEKSTQELLEEANWGDARKGNRYTIT